MLSAVEAKADPLLFEPWFRGPSWSNWKSVLRAAFAMPLSVADRAFFRTVAERDPPPRRVRELWIVAGRRSGKDSVASLLTAHAAASFESKGKLKRASLLRKGERALAACLACDRDQAAIVLTYARSYFTALAVLRGLVSRERAGGFELTNAVDIAVATNSFRSVRGRPVLTAILDESAFYRDERSTNPDEEVYRAITPGMATLPESMLIGISTPYAKRGLLYKKFKDNFGRDTDDVLVIRAPTTALNPTIDRSVIDRAMADDPVAARAEWLSEVRSALTGLIDADIIEAAVDRGVTVRAPSPGVTYFSFCDPSGGQADSTTAAIAHREGDPAVLDCLVEVRAPHSPAAAISEIAPVLKSYGLHKTVADKFAAGFAVDAFAQCGIRLEHSERDRSQLYLEVLPIFSSGRVRLIDNRRLVTQFAALERRTFSSGKDRVDHGPGGHDDACNAAAGALVLAAGKQRAFMHLITDGVLRRPRAPGGEG